MSELPSQRKRKEWIRARKDGKTEKLRKSILHSPPRLSQQLAPMQKPLDETRVDCDGPVEVLERVGVFPLVEQRRCPLCVAESGLWIGVCSGRSYGYSCGSASAVGGHMVIMAGVGVYAETP
jgi:hypothetical protein